MLDHEQIMTLHDRAYTDGQNNREKASDDLIFARLSQWDDTWASNILTEYRGQFDIIKKHRRRIIGEMRANPIQVNFKAVDGGDPEVAEIMNGMYRADMRHGEMAVNTAVQDQIDAGFGAWRLVTEYENKIDDMDTKQCVRRQSINEANNVLFFDPNSKEQDHSDAMWASIITSYTKDGWMRFAEENGIDETIPANYKAPAQSYVYPWSGYEQKKIRIGEFYEKCKETKTYYIYQNGLGETTKYTKDEAIEAADYLVDNGFEKVGEKKVKQSYVNKYLVSGEKILKGPMRIAGEHIPIVAVYGEWSWVEGQVVYQGLYRDAKDPQRLHNMAMSYAADVMAQGPRKKPIIYGEQIQGYEKYWQLNGADNNYAYLPMNRFDKDGNELPLGTGYLESAEVPTAVAQILPLTKQTVDDLTGGAINAEDAMSGQVTEGQVATAQKIVAMESFVFQDNLKIALKQEGRIYASMLAEIKDVEQEVTVIGEDGSESTEMVNMEVFDYEKGETKTLNKLHGCKCEVYTDIGPEYQTLKDQSKAHLIEMYKTVPAGTEESMVLFSQIMSLQEGPGTEVSRKYGRKKLLAMGLVDPKDEEEEAMLQAMQQPKEPGADVLLAQAEMEKAKADQMGAQISAMEAQIKQYEAQTKRAKVEIEAAVAGVDIQKKMAETQNTKVDTATKMQDAVMRRFQIG